MGNAQRPWNYGSTESRFVSFVLVGGFLLMRDKRRSGCRCINKQQPEFN
jgi:hypothetical protein